MGTAGRKMVQPLWKTVYWFLKKLKIELPYDPVILLWELKRIESSVSDVCIPKFMVALFTTAKK